MVFLKENIPKTESHQVETSVKTDLLQMQELEIRHNANKIKIVEEEVKRLEEISVRNGEKLEKEILIYVF